MSSASGWLLALDLDDTLLRGDYTILPENRRALQAFAAAGNWVVLCSGRPRPSMRPFCREIFGDGAAAGAGDAGAGTAGAGAFYIPYNGAAVLTYPEDRELFRQGLPVETAERLVRFARENGVTAQTYGDGVFYVEKADAYAEAYRRHTGLKFRAAGPLDVFLRERGEEPLKVLFNGEPEGLREIFGRVRREVPGEYHATFSKPTYLEFLHPRVNKGAALEFLAGHLGVPRRRIAAAGDSDNDREMLEAAGRGFAVANAGPAAKAAADTVLRADHEGPAMVELLQFLGFHL